MATSLVRSRAAITGTKDRLSWNEIKDGAVLQKDGVIEEVGTYEAAAPQVPERDRDRHGARRSCCRASSTGTIMSA